ncbi:MerR family transcriptional regulator [Kytococcus sp. Marseille-QA3725]
MPENDVPDSTGQHAHIGEVAERTGLSHRTIRYYEEIGLVTPTARTEGGFRLYSEEDVARLQLVTPMKPLGFSLDEMRELLDALDVLGGVGDGHGPGARGAGARELDASGAGGATGDAERLARETVSTVHATAVERVAELRRRLERAEAFVQWLAPESEG